jgi:protein-tyrosine phosphatase
MSDLSPNDVRLEERTVITSATHPIRVDFLAAELHGLPGRLGMTLAPGKCNIGMHAIWERDLETDLDRLKHEYQVEILLTLLETCEFEKLRIPNFRDRVQAHQIESWHFPIADFGTPTHMDELIELVDRILQTLQAGKTLVIHCKAGLGRTGLVTAACLIAIGYTPNDAFAHVRQARPGSLETPEQEAYAQAFARDWFQSQDANSALQDFGTPSTDSIVDNEKSNSA